MDSPLVRARVRYRLPTLIAGISLLFAPVVVDAAPACRETPESMRLYDLGFDLHKKGKDDAALAAFQESFEISGCPRAYAQMGLAHEGLGNWAKAAAILREVLSVEDRWVALNRKELQKELVTIEDQLGAAKSPEPEPESEPEPQKGSGGGGSPGHPEPPAEEKPLAADAPQTRRHTAGWAVGAVGLALGLAGGSALAVAESFKGKAPDYSTNARWADTYSLAQIGGWTAISIGGAALLTGIALVAWPEPRKDASAVRVVPSPTGFLVSGRF